MVALDKHMVEPQMEESNSKTSEEKQTSPPEFKQKRKKKGKQKL